MTDLNGSNSSSKSRDRNIFCYFSHAFMRTKDVGKFNITEIFGYEMHEKGLKTFDQIKLNLLIKNNTQGNFTSLIISNEFQTNIEILYFSGNTCADNISHP